MIFTNYHKLEKYWRVAMSKRFIDTALFDDPWFMELSKDAKLLWIYLITRCDHAGIIELNKRLVKFQTDIKDLQSILEELGNRLVTLREDLIFIPKFISFQYPNFPQSHVNQQQGAIKQLEKYGLFKDGKLVEMNSSPTVSGELTNSYVYGNGNDNGNDLVIVPEIAQKKEKFADFVSMTKDEYEKLITDFGEPFILRCVETLNAYKGSTGKKYKSDYLAIHSWVINKVKKDSNDNKGTFTGKPQQDFRITVGEQKFVKRD